MKNFLSLLIAGVIGGLVSYTLVINNAKSTEEANTSPKAVLTTNSNFVSAPFDFVYAAEKATPAVVHITAKESRALAQQRMNKQRNRTLFDFWGMDNFFGGPRNGTGSGVIISSDGIIVTNNHVIEYADIINVALTDKRTFKAVKIGSDPSTDLAVLKIEAEGLDFVEFTDSDNLKVGEWVAAIGNPFDYLESTVTAGIVSAKGRDIDIIKGKNKIEEFIQTDAAINPGNSGGALVDKEGKLVGINTAIATPTGVYAGYSFAIPSNLVQRIVSDIKENGNIERGQLGISGYSLSEVKEMVKEKNIEQKTGFYVKEVVPGSGAQFAGVLPGDIVIGANGTEIKHYDDLSEVVGLSKVGDRIKLDIIRNGKQKKLIVNLKKGI